MGEEENIEYYTIKLKEGLERQVFKKDLIKININVKSQQQKTSIQKFIFNMINNINRYYWGYGDDSTFNNIGYIRMNYDDIIIDYKYSNIGNGYGMYGIDNHMSKTGLTSVKSNHIYIYHYDNNNNNMYFPFNG